MSSKADEPVWTTKDIVDHASKWTLAGDAALLRHLEAFSEELFSKATKTNDSLNGLLDDLDAASIRLDLVKNEFLGLQNTQFIESRVYEDDETVEKPVVEKDVDKDADKEAMQNAIRESVLEGLRVLDQFYERVSLPGSDTEDEDAESFVLRPKDPYLARPLPYVIGSDEWHQTWHVGLDISDSEEEEVVEERYSDDDGSDDDLPVSDRRVLSTGDGHEGGAVPVASSTMNDSHISSDDDDDDKPNSMPSKAPLSNASFAEQLAAKLGGIRSEREDEDEEVVNTRPIQPPVTRTHPIGDLLSNEPPPLDDLDDGLFVDTGMFSSRDGLFDDDPNESFWGSISVKKTEPDKKPKEQAAAQVSAGVTKKDNRDIFDEDSDDAMFSASSAPKQSKSSSILKGYSNTITFVDDEPPELFVEKKSEASASAKAETSKPPDDKLLINAKHDRKTTSLFDDFVDPFKDDLFSGAGGLFTATPPKIPGLFDDDDTYAPPTEPPPTTRLFDDDGLDEPQKSHGGLFDDDDDEDDLFAPSASNEVRSTLFDDEPPPLDEDSLFGKDVKTKRGSLFDAEPPPLNGESLFGEKGSRKFDSLFDGEPKSSLFENSKGEDKRNSLFDDDDQNEPPPLDVERPKDEDKSNSIFEDDDQNVPPPLDVERPKDEVKRNSLFEDDDHDVPPLLDVKVSKNEDKSNSLFDDDDDDNLPPPLEVDRSKGEGRSNSLFDEESDDEDMFGGGKRTAAMPPKPAVRAKPIAAKREEKSKPKSGSSPGKLKHNLNINVNALLPGASLPKRRDSSSSLNKSQSLEETPDSASERSSDNLKHSQSLEDDREVAVDDDEGDGHIKPLFSITKNRPRVQTKRRPSTRRGRKEQLLKPKEETSNNNAQDKDEQLDNRVKQEPNSNGNYLGDSSSRVQANDSNLSRVQVEDINSNMSKVRAEDINSNMNNVQIEDVKPNLSNVQVEDVKPNVTNVQAEDINSNASRVRSKDIFDSNLSEVQAKDIFKGVDSKFIDVQGEDIFKGVDSNSGYVQGEDIFQNVDSNFGETQTKGIFKGVDSNFSDVEAEDIFKGVDSKLAYTQGEDIFQNADSNSKIKSESGHSKNSSKDVDLFSGAEDLFKRPPDTKDIYKDDLFSDVTRVKKEIVEPDDLFGPASSDNLFKPEAAKNLIKPEASNNVFKPVDNLFEPPTSDALFERVSKSESPIDIFEEAAASKKVVKERLFDEDDDGIFGGVKRTSKTTKTFGGLFDDADDGDDLFGSKKTVRFGEKKKSSAVAVQRKKDSLFDDVDEGDDIFGGGSKFATKKAFSVAEPKKSKLRSLVKRAEEKAVDYDPLDALAPKE